MTLLVLVAAWVAAACVLAALLGAVFRGARKGDTRPQVHSGTVVPLPRVGDRESAHVR